MSVRDFSETGRLFCQTFLGNGNWTQTFFSQTFRVPPYPGKIPGYPAQKVWFPWFRGTYRTFWPPPVHVEDPYPTGKYPDQKVWVWVPFSSLIFLIPGQEGPRASCSSSGVPNCKMSCVPKPQFENFRAKFTTKSHFTLSRDLSHAA